MKLLRKHNLFFPLLLILGLAPMALFQNCSQDVGFNQDQGRDVDTGPGFFGQAPGTDGEVVVRINESPDDRTNNDSDPVVDFEVLTPPEDIIELVCRLNGVVVPCDPYDRIPINDQRPGENVFTIEVTTDDGREGYEEITWTVYDDIIPRTKNFSVTVQKTDVDIIINVDNSGSMQYEQESMASRVANFMQPFKDLNYNIAITTTSPIGNATIWNSALNYVDGKFVPLADGNYCIKSSRSSLSQAQSLISNAVVRDLYLRDANGNQVLNTQGVPYPEGNGWERGIYTTYKAFWRAVNGLQGENCLRQGVPKHVIIISDERETLTDQNGNPLPEQNLSSGQNLVNYVSQQFGSETIFKFHSIIVDPFSQEGVNCLNTHGAKLGIEYGNLSQLTGGYIGSVCAQDYATQLGRIGESISNSTRSQRLDCQSVANSANSLGVVVNLATGQEVNVGYTINADKVDFDADLPAGNYQIRYYCFQ